MTGQMCLNEQIFFTNSPSSSTNDNTNVRKIKRIRIMLNNKQLTIHLIITTILLAYVQNVHSRSPQPTALIAESRVNNVAASEALLSSTEQKLTLETNSIHRQTTTTISHGSSSSGNGSSINSSIRDGGTNGDHNRSLKRVFLSNRTVTCNDGSHAGFYLRKNPHSKKWIVFLEGGWHCYDTRSCRARWLRLRHLMTSAQWPETRDVGGILSPLADENPYWHNANHVLVPYCSSDSWSGTRAEPESRENNWRFMGALILRQVIADLVPLGLGRANGAELLLVGSSAGGLGVMLNLDRVTKYLQHERKLMVAVRGISDSGWFLDREPYTPSAVASSEAVRQGWSLWQGLLPEECTKRHASEPWRCYFGYRLYPTLQSPLFIFQWLFDEAQMRADNVGAPVTPQQWNYIHEMGGALRSSLDNVTAVFAPSCIGHAVLSKRDWLNIKIDDISLPAALRCWEHSTRTRRRRHDKLKRSTEATLTLDQRQQRRRQKHHKERQDNNANHPKRNHNRNMTKEERREQRRRHRHEQQLHRRREQQNRNRKNPATVAGNALMEHINDNNNNDGLSNAVLRNDGNAASNKHRQKKHRHRNHNNNGTDSNVNMKKVRHNNKLNQQQQQQQRRRRRRKEQHLHHRQQTDIDTLPAAATERGSEFQKELPIYNELQQQPQQQQKRRASNNAQRRISHVPRVPEKCALRLLERCSWPQCNHSCPTLTNPLTGEEMRFLELLTSFGLDIEAVAAALGVDMHTLNNMDRTELVNLLTQQVS